MPRYRRPTREERIDVTEIDLDQEYQLLHGRPMIEDPMDLETFTAAWEAHRARLLPKFIAEEPGHRPFAWWVLELGKERPIQNSWFDEQAMRESPDQGMFGYLHTSCYGGPEMMPFQEPECDYLERNGLLEPAEEKAIDGLK